MSKYFFCSSLNDIKKSDIPLNVFYHTSNGIETNRMTPEIPDENISQCAKFISLSTTRPSTW